MAADVLALEEPRTRHAATSGPRRRARRRWPWIGAATVLFLGLLAGVIGNEIQASRRFDTAHHSVLANQYGIDLVLADVAGVRHQLAAVDEQVGSDSVTLTQDSSELKAAQTALSNARSHVSEQSTTIGSLVVCLGGVEQALTALSVDDQSHAIAALDAVSASCQQLAGSGG
jgi:hypothetical protein